MATEIFQSLEKGACHMFLKTFLQNLYKKYENPLLWQLKKFGCHPKNSDDKMVIENFQSPHNLSHFNCHKDG
jgi:hypothetical protein